MLPILPWRWHIEQHKHPVLGRKQRTAFAFKAEFCADDGRLLSEAPYLCFLMPLESASPPPQSFPSDILCLPLLTGTSFSSQECAVTASRQVSDPSDSEPGAEQARDECTELGCKANNNPLIMDISLNTSGCETQAAYFVLSQSIHKHLLGDFREPAPIAAHMDLCDRCTLI